MDRVKVKVSAVLTPGSRLPIARALLLMTPPFTVSLSITLSALIYGKYAIVKEVSFACSPDVGKDTPLLMSTTKVLSV